MAILQLQNEVVGMMVPKAYHSIPIVVFLSCLQYFVCTSPKHLALATVITIQNGSMTGGESGEVCCMVKCSNCREMWRWSFSDPGILVSTHSSRPCPPVCISCWYKFVQKLPYLHPYWQVCSVHDRFRYIKMKDRVWQQTSCIWEIKNLPELRHSL
jgi:hypothetical protein